MFSMDTRWQRADGSWFTTSYPEKVDPSTLSEESRRDYHMLMAERKRRAAAEPAELRTTLNFDHREALRGTYAQLVASRDRIVATELRMLLALHEKEDTDDIQHQLETLRDAHRMTYGEDVRVDINLVLRRRR